MIYRMRSRRQVKKKEKFFNLTVGNGIRKQKCSRCNYTCRAQRNGDSTRGRNFSIQEVFFFFSNIN